MKTLGRIALSLCVCVWLAPALAQQGPGGGGTSLPAQETTLFAGSGICARCHEGLFENRIDVSPVTLWRATMMGNAAKDPLWLAKVSAEGAELPLLASAIEDKCITCHSPMLHYEIDPAALTDLVGDALYRDGISCTVCHQIQPTNFGEDGSFSGGFLIDGSRTIFGPYPTPLASPMVSNAKYTPVEAYPGTGWVINDSEHCATCHNLFTHYYDPNQEPPYPSAEKFPEQTPYYEWLNSVYPGEGTSCQGCHMPRTETPIKIATRPPRLRERSPFWYHEFVGGNTFMLGLLRDNVNSLGLTANPGQFAEKILDTEAMLTARTVDLDAAPALEGSTLTVPVTLTNRAGHKLPTGIPLRRVWIHLTVTDSAGATFFESGGWQADGEIIGPEPWPSVEPHHDVIDSPNQVQIYEGVMQDALGNPTRTLLLAGSFAKDNRLPPAGFSTGHSKYIYTPIVGNAETDDDFNSLGSGADTVTYEVDVNGAPGPYTVTVEVCYQSVTPGEATYLGSYDTTEANAFDALYQASDNAPAVLATWSGTVLVP